MLDSVGVSEHCHLFRNQGAKISTRPLKLSLNIAQMYNLVTANHHKASSRNASTASTYYVVVFCSLKGWEAGGDQGARCTQELRASQSLALEPATKNALKRTNQRSCNESDGSRFGVQFFPNRADFDVFCKSFQAQHPTSHFRCVGVKDSNVSMCRSWRAIFSASDFSLPSATAVQSKYMVFVANDGFFSFLNDISSPKDYLGTSKQIKWQPHLSQSYRLNSWTSHCQDTTSCWIFQSVMVKRKTLNPQNRKEKR